MSLDRFRRAVNDFGDRWYAASLRITQHSGMAEDAVQEALISAWTKRHQFNRNARLETWIHRIVVNASLQALRRRRPEALVSEDAAVLTSHNTPDRERFADEIALSVRRGMEALTEFERVCFALKHIEQWRLREIALELGTRESRVKQAVFRAVKKLRAQLQPLREEA